MHAQLLQAISMAMHALHFYKGRGLMSILGTESERVHMQDCVSVARIKDVSHACLSTHAIGSTMQYKASREGIYL